jgi:hypothetical protein
LSNNKKAKKKEAEKKAPTQGGNIAQFPTSGIPGL